jgi:APA family basic amino acid/polyamine antiporter
MDQTRGEPVQARLGLWDAVSIIVGIIIGVGIFQNPSSIFKLAPGPWSALGIWALGGLLALVGAFCFAELASTYPRSGGEYVYLTRAFGPLVGFLFAWAQLAVIRPGSVGALAYLVGLYGAQLLQLGLWETLFLAVSSVVLLTVINVLGVTLGKNTQNLLTTSKLLGLAAIVVVGFGWGKSGDAIAGAGFVGHDGWFASAMILVLWTYAGWNEAAYIVAEVKNGRRNIPLALILGTTAVMIIYLAINAAFVLALGFQGAKGETVPAQVLELAWGGFGANAISILIMVSSLGAINGMIFTTARIYSEFGADHRLFQPLSRWSRRWGTPVRALVTQGALTLGFLVGVSAWVSLNSQGNPQMKIADGFDEMIYMTAAVFWLFFLLTGISLFVLRAKDPDQARPFRVPGYPVIPLVFCLSSAYMVYGAIDFRPWESLIALGILLLGVLFYFLPKKIIRQRVPEPSPPVPAGAL